MTRSDFYYRQIVTQAEMDQAFDDPEAAIRALSSDLDLQYGVATGMVVQEDSGGASGDIEVTTGAAYDSQGRRVPVLTLDTLDLSSLMPDANPRYVRVYGEFARTLSDPRLDGNNDPVDYRQTEEALTSFVAGVAAGSPVKPAIDTSKVLLATILIPDSATTISDSDISMATDIENALADPDRVECGVLIKRGQLITDDLYWDETLDREISGLQQIQLKAGTGGQLGADFGGRYLDGIGVIRMGVNSIIEIDELRLDATGLTDPAIDMNGRNIGDVGDITGVDSIGFELGTGAEVGIDLNNRQLEAAATVELEPGSGAGVDTNGKNIETNGGDIIMGDGDLSGVAAITGISGSINIAGQIRTNAADLYANGDIHTDLGDVQADAGDVIAANDHKYGAVETFKKFVGVADFVPILDNYGANVIRAPAHLTANAAGPFVFDAIVRVPHGSEIKQFTIKQNAVGATNITADLFRVTHRIEASPTGAPTSASISSLNIATTGWTVASGSTLSEVVGIDVDYYMVRVVLTANGDQFGGVRISYETDNLRAENTFRTP